MDGQNTVARKCGLLPESDRPVLWTWNRMVQKTTQEWKADMYRVSVSYFEQGIAPEISDVKLYWLSRNGDGKWRWADDVDLAKSFQTFESALREAYLQSTLIPKIGPQRLTIHKNDW